VVHFEIGGKDVSGLRQSYKGAFDWYITPVPTMNYATIAPCEPDGIGGGIEHTNGPRPVTFYIRADDLEAALECIQSLGGKIVTPIEIPNVVGLVIFADPERHIIGLVKS
jgi:predicted enzyme related to lactoylglutathione lyase